MTFWLHTTSHLYQFIIICFQDISFRAPLKIGKVNSFKWDCLLSSLFSWDKRFLRIQRNRQRGWKWQRTTKSQRCTMAGFKRRMDSINLQILSFYCIISIVHFKFYCSLVWQPQRSEYEKYSGIKTSGKCYRIYKRFQILVRILPELAKWISLSYGSCFPKYLLKANWLTAIKSSRFFSWWI